MLGQKESLELFKQRLPWIFYGIFFFLVVIMGRLFYLQVVKGETYRFFSQKNSLRKEKIRGPRGKIYDRRLELLVDNRLQLDVTITPQYAGQANEIISLIAEITDVPIEQLTKHYQKERRKQPSFAPVTILPDAPWALIVKIEARKKELPGIDIETNIKRVYLGEEVGAHLMGYLAEVNKRDLRRYEKQELDYQLGDLTGRSGLESQWESTLRGVDGFKYVVVDAHGHRLVKKDQSASLVNYLKRQSPAQPGKSLVLTIDQELQRTAATALEGKMGSVVALDPRTGEVLAMHSMPGFDPTEMTTKRNELWQSFIRSRYGPLRNKAVQDFFPPGSTFKIFSAMAGLQADLITPNTLVKCPGHFRFGRRTYHCHKRGGHGWVNLQQAIRQSCDVFFYTLATKIGIDQISAAASKFGLGQKTGIKLSHETPGLMPTEAWKKKTRGTIWLPGETLSASIGQGANLVTPIQLAAAYSTFANGGNFYKPYIVSRILDEDGHTVERFTPQLRSHYAYEESQMEAIKKGLWDVVNHPKGTGYWRVRSDKVEISGKSGTTQVISLSKEDLYKPCKKLPFDKRHHAWFVGYAPSEKPEIVVAAFGMHACGGSTTAGPIVKAVIEKWHDLKMQKETQVAASAKSSPGLR